jgi:hypothetical protein
MKKFLVLALLSVIAVSCGKYEEGPGFSLISKKNRVTNTWVLSKVEVNGQDETPQSSSYTLKMTLKEDETVSASYTIFTIPYTTTGTWAFNSDKSALILTDNSGTSTNTILRLTNKEMKLRQIANGDTTINTFVVQ